MVVGTPAQKLGWALGGTGIMGAEMFVAGGGLGQGFTWMSPREPQTEPPVFRPVCFPVLK